MVRFIYHFHSLADMWLCFFTYMGFVFFWTGKGRPVLDWARRVRIAIGSAKGLAYLHEDCKFFFIKCESKA